MSEEIEGNPIAHEDAIGRLLNSLRSGGPAALGLARSHLPGLAEASNTTLRARGFELADAELAHARHYGFESWPALRAELFRAGLEPEEAKGPFVRAVDAIHAADLRRLERSLVEHPELIERRPRREALDPLLFQAISCREVGAVQLLLQAGASVEEPAGGGFLPIHRAAYGHPPEARPGGQREHRAILELLIDAGSPLERSAGVEGATPLAMALFWGHRSLAELLRERGARVTNLRTAAALGELEELRGMLGGKELAPAAAAGRGFYRPHDGFPEWSPLAERQEILDEAFVWAARSGRHGAMELLLEHGANIDGCPYDATALIHVAGSGPLETLRWLLEHGASSRARGNFPRGATALHLACAQGHLEAVKLLQRAGARPGQKDEEFGIDALGYAEWGGHQDIIDLLSRR